jgi:hypothetical protein
MENASVSNASSLKEKHRLFAERHSEPSRVRLHRAISWLKRSEAEQIDADAKFIFLWIAFNAAYAWEFGFEGAERDQQNRFFSALLGADSEARLHAALFSQFSGPVRTMIDNKFVFEPFWRALRDHDSSGKWELQFEASKKSALRSIMLGDTAMVLSVLFDRLYVLRNQLVHGGATWNGGINRAQVRDGATVMSTLVPLVIEVMLDSPDQDFGAILYPVV